MNYRERARSSSAEIPVSKKNNQKFSDFIPLKRQILQKVGHFAQKLQNFNITHGGRNDYARHVVTNTHLGVCGKFINNIMQ